MTDTTEQALLARLNRPGKGPPCSKTLGMRAIGASVARGSVSLAFTAPPAFGNPMGNVQGGFLCAMLDETASIAAVVKSDFSILVPTLEMKTSFLAPAPLGKLIGHGQVLRLGKSVAFIESEIWTPDNTVCARATSTAKVIARPDTMNSLSASQNATED